MCLRNGLEIFMPLEKESARELELFTLFHVHLLAHLALCRIFAREGRSCLPFSTEWGVVGDGI